MFSSFCATLENSLAHQQDVRGDAFHGDVSLVKLAGELVGEVENFEAVWSVENNRAHTESN